MKVIGKLIVLCKQCPTILSECNVLDDGRGLSKPGKTIRTGDQLCGKCLGIGMKSKHPFLSGKRTGYKPVHGARHGQSRKIRYVPAT